MCPGPWWPHSSSGLAAALTTLCRRTFPKVGQASLRGTGTSSLEGRDTLPPNNHALLLPLWAWGVLVTRWRALLTTVVTVVS